MIQSIANYCEEIEAGDEIKITKEITKQVLIEL
jgi:hypothetical protein